MAELCLLIIIVITSYSIHYTKLYESYSSSGIGSGIISFTLNVTLLSEFFTVDGFADRALSNEGDELLDVSPN